MSYIGFGLSCSPSKSPQPKAHDYLPTKKCPRDKSPQNIIGTVSNVGFWPLAFGRGQMDLVGKLHMRLSYLMLMALNKCSIIYFD